MKDNGSFDVLKRIMAVVLCAFIFVGYTPSLAFAEGEVEDNQTIQLVEKTSEAKEGAIDGESADTDELLMGYLNKGISGITAPKNGRKLRAKSAPRGEMLDDICRDVYYRLKEQIADFANPETEATKETSVFTLPAEPFLTDGVKEEIINGNQNVFTITENDFNRFNEVNINQRVI